MSLAEQYLIQEYGAYRDHYEWKALEKAFDEGYSKGQRGIHEQYSNQIKLLEDQLIKSLDGKDPSKAKQSPPVLG